ncbi:CYCLIC NUCLEOTIDE-GATED ION CHANNEL 8-RELATED [Salix koriyanagi]|uniref:CYCLIC NUCLEOTIDE-GATED ION CHANNEL 8-RELATED n=1 Tax=Salix koriyanagi TaxID=2511006 RepID=A0A9Q0T5Q4_9ROSI|nr:CYCLIC NUCLEOTIDE-GATED ION CHANNEL 8-RELATED [Salix koriyanagi]
MFDCGYKSQYIGGQKEKFVRLDDFDSLSVTSSNKGMKKLRFNVEGFNISGHEKKKASKYFRYGVKKGSQGLMTIGRSLKTGVARAVFLEDLKVSEKMIFDPQHKSLLLWNRLLVMSCILSVSIDPLFFYLPIFNYQMTCLGMDTKLAAAITTMRTILDVFYLIRIALQFRTAYVAPSSRVFGRGELVIDPAQIASRYLSRYFIVDFLSVLPLPQIVVWKYLNNKTRGSEVLATKQALLVIVFAQYIPRFGRFFPLTSDLKKSAGSFAESVLAGAAYYLLCTLGQGLRTSTYPLEVIFSILLAISGLILFALLIGNMQTYLQSLSVRLEEMRIKRRDSEQWMHHRLLPQDLRERVRRYDQYKWLETRGVDEENLVQSLPKDLRRDIKRHLCLNLVRRVPLFANMDERLLDAICERLRPSLYTEETYIVREGDPVDNMLFIIRGRLESVTTDGGRSGFFNRGVLREGDFCGEELLTWALDPKSLGNLPLSTRTVGALTEVEAFALEAEELKFVASQFRRLHSRQRRRDDDVDYDEENDDNDDDERELVGQLGSARLRATIFASRFAANALRGHKLRSSNSRGLKMLQKPPEPDFNEE